MKIMQNKNFLLGQIILKKKVMYHRANHLGFTHSSVVACSQELDTLLNQYQEIHGSFKQLAPTY
jgi:stage 0 sporulation regulatory protein